MDNAIRSVNRKSQSSQNTKYIVILGVLLFIMVILGIAITVIFMTKNNEPNDTETLAKKTCANSNGSFIVDGYQYYLNATNYYSCKTNERTIFDIYVFKDSFLESPLGNLSLSNAQTAGKGNVVDGMTISDVGTDRYKVYRAFSDSYLFYAGFNNLNIELNVKSIEQADKFLRELGYPE